MKKKIVSALLAAAAVLVSFTGVFAQEEPVVMWAERQIVFDRPEGEYINDVYMAPVRRVCSMAGASVDWYADEQMVVINSKDNLTRLFMYIGKDTLRVFTFTSVADGTAEEFPLAAPLKIVDDRTLVPLEQVLTALKVVYTWSEDKSTITVDSGMEITDEERLTLSVQADKEDVSAGDEVTVSIVASNLDLYPEYAYSGYSAGIIYNKDEFELVSSGLTLPDGTDANAMGAENGDFSSDMAKVVYVTTDVFDYTEDTAVVGKVVLRALTDNGGKIALSNRIHDIGYDTTLVLTKRDDLSLMGFDSADKMDIVTEPIEIK